MAARTQPPFRADHVGSLLRPRELHDLREKVQQGKASAAEQPAFILGNVDPEAVAACRRQFSFLADKKFELYSALYKSALFTEHSI